MSWTVAITGVSGGIGQATARLFGDEGWRVLGIDRRQPSGNTAIDEFLELDLGGDVSDSLVAFFASCGSLDTLVNAAAIQGTSRLVDTDAGAWDAVMAVNARAAFLAMTAAHSHLAQSGGAVVNVASVHAVATSAGVGGYAASKGAVVALTRSAAIEWAPAVRVNAVLPGAIDTPMLRQGLARNEAALDPGAALQQLASRTPLQRIGDPADVAQAIMFLADSERSSFITGQALVVDGGALSRLSTE
jgi:NAD(P)-dependent dehydrogenase (short-subunit alcohol dehydrogenase family)